MLAASPITRQTVGRTFIVAGSLLATIGVVQFGLLMWAYAHRQPGPPRSISIAAITGGAAALPDTEKLDVTDLLPSGEPAAPATPAAANSSTATPPAEPGEATVAALTPPRPVPLNPRPPTLMEPEQSDLFKETINLGKLLRERSDMSTALTRFREASVMDPKSPEPLYELAVTFEKMTLPDKAAEQWRRIYEMGEAAGPYYTAAEARLNQAKQTTMKDVVPGANPATTEVEEGVTPGKILGILPVTVQDEEDRASAKKLSLSIPIKARGANSGGPPSVSVRDLTIQVLFYDTVDSKTLVQTTANVSSRWTSAPADWVDSNIETLEVDYQLPLPDAKAARRENRKYFGYLIRIYYKSELQASAGDPEQLVQQFPPEENLPDATLKNPKKK